VARGSVRLNRGGVSKVLKSPEFAVKMNTLAQAIADDIGEDAEVSEYTTDRRAASVSVPAHRQARDGALTRAAASVGLEVRIK
jgi:hypothetical protein